MTDDFNPDLLPKLPYDELKLTPAGPVEFQLHRAPDGTEAVVIRFFDAQWKNVILAFAPADAKTFGEMLLGFHADLPRLREAIQQQGNSPDDPE